MKFVFTYKTMTAGVGYLEGENFSITGGKVNELFWRDQMGRVARMFRKSERSKNWIVELIIKGNENEQEQESVIEESSLGLLASMATTGGIDTDR